jgi:shikimate dehydrogenase
VAITRCAVLGRPIVHSLSPVLHRTAYDELGLDWTYGAVDVGVDELPAFVTSLGPEWRGLSLTMPLKRAVLPLLDEVDDVVGVSGVANTVLLDPRGRRGANTDVPGAVAALRERTSGRFASAVVLGGGATATSVLLALADLGCGRVTLLVREPARAAETVQAARRHPTAPDITVATLGTRATADVLVSTVPAAAQTLQVVDTVHAPVLFDVVYDPWPTPLAAAALASGALLVSGLDLLVHQAALQVALMTGVAVPDVPLAAMRAAGEQTLRERSADA